MKKPNKNLLISKKLFIILMLFFSILKFYKIGSLGYITDEGQTAQYSNVINQKLFPCSSDICLIRGLPYIYPVSLITYFFGVNESAVRIFGVFFSIFSLFVLYKILKKLSFKKNTIFLSLLLINSSDWFFSFSRYARMYTALLFYILSSIWYFILFYKNNKYLYLLLFYITFLFSIFTHQFGILLGFLLVTPMFTNNKKMILNYRYVLFCLLMMLTVVFFMTKIPGLIYSNEYIGFYDLNPSEISKNRLWFLDNFQLPNINIINDLFFFLPIPTVLFIVYCIEEITQKKQSDKNILLYFLIFSLFFILIYKIQFSTKYLWWILPFIYVFVTLKIEHIDKKNILISKFIVLSIVLPSFFGILNILSRNYGSSFYKNWLISPTHTADYYVDDKTPIEFISREYKDGDTIITDYWIHDVYLELFMKRKSDFFISEWDGNEFINRFPYYKLYPNNNGDFYLSKEGPLILKSVEELNQIIDSRSRVWIVSSSDNIGRKHEHISSREITDFLNKENNNVVYLGKDSNTKVYLFKKE